MPSHLHYEPDHIASLRTKDSKFPKPYLQSTYQPNHSSSERSPIQITSLKKEQCTPSTLPLPSPSPHSPTLSLQVPVPAIPQCADGQLSVTMPVFLSPPPFSFPPTLPYPSPISSLSSPSPFSLFISPTHPNKLKTATSPNPPPRNSSAVEAIHAKVRNGIVFSIWGWMGNGRVLGRFVRVGVMLVGSLVC